jgi:hypothetical protein
VFDGKYKLGVYSDGVVCDALLRDGLCDFAWLSASTAFPGSKDFFHSGRWALAQREIDLDWAAGLSVDTDDAKNDFGAFRLDVAAPVAVARPAMASIPAVPAAGMFDAAAATTSRMTAPAGMSAATATATYAALAAAGLGAAIMAAPLAAVPMQALRIGMRGPLVQAWQNFLVGQGFDPGGAEGDFGDKTQTATMAFQQAQGLKADGVVGQQTFAKAMALGFHLVEEPDTDETGTNFPPRPNFPSLQRNSQRMDLFGHFDFVPAPTADDREHIRILGSWVQNNIIDVPIPQLRRTRIRNPPAAMPFHRLAAAQLKALWQAWEDANLLDLILTYDGAFEPRFKRGQSNGGLEALSNHAFGSAFDINADLNSFGTTPLLVGQEGSVRKLVPIANAHGFYWGGHFSTRPDGMHFEIALLQP